MTDKRYCQRCGHELRRDEQSFEMEKGIYLCEPCLELEMEEQAPECVAGRIRYYGKPVQKIEAKSGFRNTARVSVYQHGGRYLQTADYDIYLVGAHIATSPFILDKKYKSVTEALKAGIAEVHKYIEQKVREYPHKAAELRSLTKQLMGQMTVDIFEG